MYAREIAVGPAEVLDGDGWDDCTADSADLMPVVVSIRIAPAAMVTDWPAAGTGIVVETARWVNLFVRHG